MRSYAWEGRFGFVFLFFLKSQTAKYPIHPIDLSFPNFFPAEEKMWFFGMFQ